MPRFQSIILGWFLHGQVLQSNAKCGEERKLNVGENCDFGIKPQIQNFKTAKTLTLSTAYLEEMVGTCSGNSPRRKYNGCYIKISLIGSEVSGRWLAQPEVGISV